MKSDTNTSPSVTTKPAPVKVTSPSPRNTRGYSSVDTTVPLVVQMCSNSSSVQISVKINSWELKGVPSNDEWQDWLVDDSLDQELIISQKQEYDDKKELLTNAMKILSDREKKIIEARRLSENPKTLEELSKEYKISRERIRQIETKAFEKLQKSMINASKSKNLLPAN